MRSLLISSFLLLASAVSDTHYSTNAICRRNNCINPLFPGLTDLSTLEVATLQCQSHAHVRRYLRFCEPVINYDVALPSPNSSTALQSIVAAQEKAAVTMYFLHLAGMNLEPQEHKNPQDSSDKCVQAVWSMVCNTYLPKSEAGCSSGQSSAYLRPCKNVCGRYLEACDVRCCDEGTECVFEHTVSLAQGGSMTLTGYSPQLGPSAQCTGGTNWDNSGGAPHTAGRLAPSVLLVTCLTLVLQLSSLDGPNHRGRRSHASRAVETSAGSRRALAVLLAGLAVGLQGCDPVGHAAAAWETKTSYLLDYQFVQHLSKSQEALGIVQAAPVLNSCEVTNLPEADRCSGHGVCKQWNASSINLMPLFFCECDRDWADPECRTQRKSQAKAYVLSLFTGYLGLDRFYLGEHYTAMAKLATLGGLGFWWLIDIARIGSSPVYADKYRVAADLPHNIYVIVTVGFFAAIGFWVFGILAASNQKKRAKNLMLMKAEQEFIATGSATTDINAMDRVGMPVRAGYRIAVPTTPSTYGTMAPPEVRISGYMNPFSCYSSYTNAERMYSSVRVPQG